MKRTVTIAATLLLVVVGPTRALAQDATALPADSSDRAAAEERDTVGAAVAAPPAREATSAQEGVEPTLAEALSGGTAGVNLRYRFEFVVDDKFDLDARASTLRTTLGYGTRPFHGFRLYLQVENVANVGLGDHFNNKGAGDSGNGVTDRPVVVDPPGTEILQSYLEYAANGSTVQLGRQVINLDDQRFVGAVGWRQHWQTFDAVRFRNTRLSNFTFDYIYIGQVNRIFRDQQDTASHLIHGQYRIAGVGAVTAYGYLLRYDDAPFWGLSRDTLGVEFKGSRAAGSVTLHYEAEFAHQSDAGSNPKAVDADYVHLMGGVGTSGFTLRVDWERIGGSRSAGQFQFVLGTNHAFNGWVDKFLSTPTNGLSDLMVRLDGPLGPVKWQLRYHDFRAVTGDVRYGTEFDFLATYSAPWKQTFALKGGVYDADQFSRSTTKVWVWTSYSF